LSLEGQRQLDEVAEALRGIPFVAVYSSDLQRAVYGGKAIAKCTGLELKISPTWREMFFGECEGLTFQEIKDKYPQLAESIIRPEGQEIIFPGGESDRGFRARISQSLSDLRHLHDQGHVALVAHAGVLRAILAEVLNLSTAAMWSLTQDFASLDVIDFHQDGQVQVRLVNGYLGPEGYTRDGRGRQALIGLK
jgi:alpha-ribazole phosphatase